MTRVVLLAPDTPPRPGALAAGPGIRYAELASALRRERMSVILASPEPGADAVWRSEDVGELLAGADAVIVPQGNADLGRELARQAPASLPIVADLYAPLLVENLALAHAPRDAVPFRRLQRRAMELIRRADLFLVANERQRLYTLGLLSAAGRLNPLTYRSPPILEVGYGVPDDRPAPPAFARVARGVLVPEDAALALWYGGVYPWFDATTAVRGFARALETVPDAHLVFVGPRHPRAHAPDGEYVRALDVVRELGLEERVHEAPWSPYEERVAWYAEADCAICLHHPGLETDLSNRTRLGDLLWGGVPLVCTAGDFIGERAAAAGAAIAVPAHDDRAAGEALAAILADDARRVEARTAAWEVARSLAWPTVLAPLVEWLQRPRIAADRFAPPPWRPALGALAKSFLQRG
jgi:glycosyltransferase involved in cell wall biosynthesis